MTTHSNWPPSRQPSPIVAPTSMIAPKLKLATPKDIELLLSLVRAYHAFKGVSLSYEARRTALEPLVGESDVGRIWLIEVQDFVVGYLALCFGYSIEFAGRDAFIDEFFIMESHRGRGIGRAALTLVCNEARNLGVVALHLEVVRQNDRARGLYSSVGFEARERFHLMSRKLDGDAQ